MKYYVLLCTKQWKIEKILHRASDVELTVDTDFLELFSDSQELKGTDSLERYKQNVKLLHWKADGNAISVIICTFSRHYLVFLVNIKAQEDFTEFAEIYAESLAWAQDHLEVDYSDEYYRIEQMNNQLINSQRALVKNNQQLKRVLGEIREANNQIAVLERDELTNLYCASAFYRKAEEYLKKDPETAWDIIVLDIDHFKRVNEIFGRKAGDQMLQNLALFISGFDEAEKGIFARESGDTFYILMPADFKYYDWLSHGLKGFFDRYPMPVHVLEKIGVYKVTDFDIPVEQMCGRARLALDTIHTRDKKRIAFYDEALHHRLMMEHKILDSLQDAIDNQEFQMYLQPKIDMDTDKIIGAEALIRWIHPEMGFVPPDQFIPVLEKEGHIYQVDKYIWEEACKALRKCKDLGVDNIAISVNMARGDLYQKDLPEVLDGLLEKYRLDADSLHLEIIERAYVNDSVNMLPILSKLREKGFLIEVDDFGTGESSLSMVADMPVDVLKLDRTFLISCFKSERHEAVIGFIINLAKSLHMDIIAEGVETKEQAEFLKEKGCRYVQGYYYGKPIPAKELIEQIVDRKSSEDENGDAE